MKSLAIAYVLAAALLLIADQERNRMALPYQSAVGTVEALGDGKVRVNWDPCERGKFINFMGNIRIKSLGRRQCNNGKIYDAVQVTQCGGNHDQSDSICKSPS